MNNIEKGILLIGNFLSKDVKTRALCEEFAIKLSKEGYLVYKTSQKKEKIRKLFDILLTIYKLRNKYSISIIDLFSAKAFWWGFLSGFFLNLIRKDFIIVLRGGELPDFSKKNGKYVKYLLQRAKRVVAPSEYLKKEMENFRDDIIVIPNPIEIKNYEFHLREKVQKRILWLRAFHYVYNPMMAIQTLEEVMRQDKDFFLCMIGPDKGDGSLKEIKNILLNNAVKNNLEIIEGVPKEKVPFYLNNYDIFLNTSNIDNLPVSVLEAMACGLGVITTEVGGIPYFLKHNEDAIFVPKNDFKKMAEAVLHLLKDISLCKKLSYNARKKAENFSWEKVLPLWEEIING